MKFCWILLCHNINQHVENEYLKIKKQLKEYEYIDVVLLQDNVDFNYNDLCEKYNTFDTDETNVYNRYIGNSIFPIIDYSKNHDFDYYIIQEYDCMFTGNYKNIIENINICEFDAIFQSKPTHVYKSFWYWKQFSNIPINKNNFFNLLQFYIINKKTINLINDYYNIGYKGHYEEVVYTVVENNRDVLNVDYLDNYFNVYMDWNIDNLSQKLKDTVGIEYDQNKHNEYIKSIIKHFENKNTFLHPIKYI